MNSDMTKPEAYTALDLPIGADKTQITASYKRLAEQWFPEKHNNNRDAIKKFQEISMAFYKLLSHQDKVLLTYPQMLKLYQEVNYQPSSYSNGYDESSGSDESESESDEEEDGEGDMDALQERLHPANGTNGHSTGENSQLNAIGLSGDNKAKKKADKRRAKKKRRREKKKLEKLEQTKKDGNDTELNLKEAADKSKSKKKKNNGLEDSEDEFDSGAAFFTHVINKKKKSSINATASESSNHKMKEIKSKATNEESEDLDPIVLRSRQLAIRGNQMANSGHYQAAIDLFTEAIRLDSGDFRFFGNRSFCYDRVNQFERALKDAARAISLSPEWPKGYFRKGRALAGLKLYAEAEIAFTQVLKLDRNCEDAHQELHRVRTHQISEMGFSAQQAEVAIQTYGSVQQALDSLLADVAENALTCEVYESDDDDYNPPLLQRSAQQSPSRVPMQPATITHPADIKLDARNPEGLTALWVGNVLPEVTSKTLEGLFAKYGAVTSVRCLPEKYCAFVNFKSKESAGNAMHSLQGKECGGQKLLIKFPDNPVTSSTNPTGNLILKKPKNSKPPPPTPSVLDDDKPSGPVNGDECYFWRTTGCQFGRTCRHSHLPESKGVDRKPWQKS